MSIYRVLDKLEAYVRQGTVLPLKLTFAKEDKIRAMHDQCGSPLLEDKQALERGLSAGRGSCWLSLTDEQYQALNLKQR